MAFRHTTLGALVATNPREAHKRFTEAFARHENNQAAVAQEFGVDRGTLARWLDALAALGEEYEVEGRGTAKRGLGSTRRARKVEEPAPEPRHGRRRRYAGASL